MCFNLSFSFKSPKLIVCEPVKPTFEKSMFETSIAMSVLYLFPLILAFLVLIKGLIALNTSSSGAPIQGLFGALGAVAVDLSLPVPRARVLSWRDAAWVGEHSPERSLGGVLPEGKEEEEEEEEGEERF